MSSSEQQEIEKSCISHPGQVCYERVLPSESHYYKPRPPPKKTSEPCNGVCIISTSHYPSDLVSRDQTQPAGSAKHAFVANTPQILGVHDKWLWL